MLNVSVRPRMLGIILGLCVFPALLIAPSGVRSQPAPAMPEGPVAYVGHGAMFDRNGNELAPTPAFIQRAQRAYLQQLLQRADPGQRQRFRELEARLRQGLTLEGQTRLVLNSRLIDWLIRTVRPEGSDRLLGINNVMKLELRQMLPETPRDSAPRERFEIPDELRQRLLDAGLAEGGAPAGAVALATTAGGAAYRELCRSNGVPVPPDWGTSPWIARGILDNEFISANRQAEVFTFQSASPAGMCIALPRFDASDTIRLLGVICLGKASGKACFWDNQSGGTQFFPRRGEVVPFSRFGGGADLVDSVGGVCTECHAGENPYVIHPGTSLGLPALAGLPLFADRWYEPLVQPGWPENAGPLNSPGACAACHTNGGPGGRFPELSTLIPGFCDIILAQAIARTMPPGAPGSLAGDPHPISLEAMCEKAPQSGPFALDGKITFLRVHDVGTKFGPPGDQLDVEVVVNLDSSDQAFGLQLRRDTNAAAHMGMLDDLREAFNRDRRVRLEWMRVGPGTGRIIRVIRLN
jgi:hypothetical protein